MRKYKNKTSVSTAFDCVDVNKLVSSSTCISNKNNLYLPPKSAKRRRLVKTKKKLSLVINSAFVKIFFIGGVTVKKCLIVTSPVNGD